jgi:hypothetical protein
MDDVKKELSTPTKTEAPKAPVVSAEVIDTRSPLEVKVDDLVENWVISTYRNSPISRDTKAYNHLRSKLPALKAAIMEEFK